MDKLAMLAVFDHLLSDPSASAWIFNIFVLTVTKRHSWAPPYFNV